MAQANIPGAITFFVPGPPQSKARARTVHHGGRVHSYTPDKTVLYENLIKTQYYSEYHKSGLLFGAGVPVEVYIDAYFGIPKSATKKAAQLMKAGLVKPTKKPDADNIAKVVCDALNGVAYKDDTQVVKLSVCKSYNTVAEGLLVTIVKHETGTV